MTSYDYIICGGGMAGLSMAYYLSQSPTLRHKRTLLIEPEEKNRNDRTWAFWEKEPNAFAQICYRTWENVNFITADNRTMPLQMDDYCYKLIRGIDFYAFVLSELRKNFNITFLQDKVSLIKDADNYAVVQTASGEEFRGQYVFDSTRKLQLNRPDCHNLLQHFKGYVIETAGPVFDPSQAEMMNFSVPQINDECRFMYVLPFDPRRALVEYTVFSESLLPAEAYDFELRKYLEKRLSNTIYVIDETEFGVIPMTDEPVSEFPSPHVIRIGTAGGYTNPATGYTFTYTQKRLREIVNKLENDQSPRQLRSRWQQRHRLYASVLLNVLRQKRYPAAEVFRLLYERNPPALIFKFLDGETNFLEELRVMRTTPLGAFTAAAGAVLLP